MPVLLLAQDHLLISEILIPPDTESRTAFIEIYNPTDQPVDMGQYYLANYNTYYNMVNGQYSANTIHFLCDFSSAGVSLAPGKNLVVALDGSAFREKFGKAADFEIAGTDPDTPDLNARYVGSNPTLEFTRGMVVLFTWDGNSDLVQDVDYIPWGLLPFSSYWMDKGGVSVDGPDADATPSTYKDDLAVSQQKAPTAPTGGLSLQRLGITEINETATDGNGLTGHNEATEDWQQSFVATTPSPGSFSEVPGDGTGTAWITPDTVDVEATTDLEITVQGTPDYELESVRIIIPADLSWSRTAADVSFSSTGFSAANLVVSGDTITITGARVTDQQLGTITVQNVTMPSSGGKYVIPVYTAVQNGHLTPLAAFPTLFVFQELTIAQIQNNSLSYEGQTVTVTAVVTIGVNVTRTDRTDAYVQDASGRGINLSASDTNYPELERGNEVEITGTVHNYVDSNGDTTTQIQDFTLGLIGTGKPIPAVSFMTTGEANNIALEGTFIETAGVITDLATGIGGGTNITIDDGSGALRIRIWDTSGLDLSGFATGDTIGILGVIDTYRGAAQLLVAYQQDIFHTSLAKTSDGAGSVTVQPDSVGKAETVSLTFDLTVQQEDTLAHVKLTLPSDWQWSGLSSDVELSGAFQQAQAEVSDRAILLSELELTATEGGQLTINNLTSPNADTASVFEFRTAGPNGRLRPIATQPVVLVGNGTGLPVISIEEARNKNVGSAITIKGVITIGAGVLRTNFTDAYIQDESGYGINIYMPGGLDNLIKRGNLVVLSGVLDEYQGKKEIVNYKATLLKTNVEIPGVRALSTQEASGTGFEGSYVQVLGAITEKSYSGGGTNIVLDDGTGAVTVRVWDTANLDLSGFAKGEYVVVRGVVSIYNNAGQILLGYQEDIYRPQYEGIPTFLKVENKPFVPDYGEKISIRYSAGGQNTQVVLRIFDLSGRLVTTLMNGKGLPFTTTTQWDGKDKIGDWVPVGTYICHLEVVNTDTGKRTVKMAPIVVGTVLR